MRLRPFFKYFGSKNSSASMYQYPRFDTIIEPFAGGAGYSLNYPEKQVILFDADERVVKIWRYLIAATANEITDLPLMNKGDKITDLGLPEPQTLFLSCWVNVTPFRITMQEWKGGDGNSLWSGWARDMVASQVDLIRHWKVEHIGYSNAPNITGTWFIDPPYIALQKHYRESARNPIDFVHLGEWCRSRSGQTIVCEQEGADWLPFRYLGQTSAARGSRKCSEVVWTNQPDKQLTMFGAQ